MSVLTVALTGGIATGKSIVAEVLHERGCHVESADRVARELLDPGRAAWREVVAHFGKSILNPDRTVDRRRLAAIIFAEDKERRCLNHILHPRVMAQKKRTIRGLERLGRSAIFVSEAALTVEAGFADFFDKLIVTDCPRAVQVARLMARDGIGRAQALRRLRAQLPGEARRRLADYLIDTAGPIEQTRKQAAEVYESLRRDLREKTRRERVRGSAGGWLKTAGRRPKGAP